MRNYYEHQKYLPGNRADHSAIRQRAGHEQDPFSFQFSSLDTGGENSD